MDKEKEKKEVIDNMPETKPEKEPEPEIKETEPSQENDVTITQDQLKKKKSEEKPKKKKRQSGKKKKEQAQSLAQSIVATEKQIIGLAIELDSMDEAILTPAWEAFLMAHDVAINPDVGLAMAHGMVAVKHIGEILPLLKK